jgi:hypothetical protein
LPNAGFTLAEDAALKQRLSALTVSDDRDMRRPIKTFFRYPDAETEKTYPFATIELIDIEFDAQRQHSEVNYYYTTSASAAGIHKSGANALDYFPSEYNNVDIGQLLSGPTEFMATDQFVPVNLMYQVSTYCRSQRHDRQLTATMLRYVFPFRRGFIEIPEDGTVRRCDMLDWRQADVLDQEAGFNKRIFRKVYTVRINAEIPQKDIFTVKAVSEVNGTIRDNYTDSDVLSTSFSEDF